MLKIPIKTPSYGFSMEMQTIAHNLDAGVLDTSTTWK